MRILKVLLIPAALAIAPAVGNAAPASPGGAAEQARTAIEATPVYHRGWRHDRGYGPRHRYRSYRYSRPHYRPYRYNYRPYRYHAPRCYWSQRWQRRICR
jgi:hypothetical protein